MDKLEYNLLRAFNNSAAESGEPICGYNGEPFKFVAAAGPNGETCVRTRKGNVLAIPTTGLRMAPVGWVRGKPVYPGSTLYSHDAKAMVTIVDTVSKADYVDGPIDWVNCKDGYTRAFKDMQWVAPVRKVKMWKALLKNNLDYYTSEYFYETEEAARLAIGGAYVRLLANTEIQVDVPCS